MVFTHRFSFRMLFSTICARFDVLTCSYTFRKYSKPILFSWDFVPCKNYHELQNRRRICFADRKITMFSRFLCTDYHYFLLLFGCLSFVNNFLLLLLLNFILKRHLLSFGITHFVSAALTRHSSANRSISYSIIVIVSNWLYWNDWFIALWNE